MHFKAPQKLSKQTSAVAVVTPLVAATIDWQAPQATKNSRMNFILSNTFAMYHAYNNNFFDQLIGCHGELGRTLNDLVSEASKEADPEAFYKKRLSTMAKQHEEDVKTLKSLGILV